MPVVAASLIRVSDRRSLSDDEFSKNDRGGDFGHKSKIGVERIDGVGRLHGRRVSARMLVVSLPRLGELMQLWKSDPWR